MTGFDKLCEELSSKSRKISRTERYPKDINLSRDFLDLMENEYFTQYGDVGNRNFHSNFLKAISFELDRFKGNAELMAKYAEPEVVVEPEVFEIGDGLEGMEEGSPLGPNSLGGQHPGYSAKELNEIAAAEKKKADEKKKKKKS